MKQKTLVPEKPPVQQPAQQPPAEQPPVEQPPVEQPPAQQPPAEQPPVQQPPAEQPRVEQPPVQQPAQLEVPELPKLFQLLTLPDELPPTALRSTSEKTPSPKPRFYDSDSGYESDASDTSITLSPIGPPASIISPSYLNHQEYIPQDPISLRNHITEKNLKNAKKAKKIIQGSSSSDESGEEQDKNIDKFVKNFNVRDLKKIKKEKFDSEYEKN